MGHFFSVHVLVNGGIRRGTQSTHHQQDLFLLDQTTNHFNCLWRAVAIVQTDEVDFASVDAALFVQLFEISRLHFADRAVSRGGSAVGHGLTDFDFRVAGTGIVFFLC